MPLAVLVAGVFALPFAVPPAHAANTPGEVAESTLEMAPIKGKLYKEKRVPVEWRVEVQITAPYPEVPKIRPVKQITASFPKEMIFAPAKGLPVCPDSLLNPGSSTLGLPVDEMIKRCPGSLIGNGRAKLYLSKINYPDGTNLNGSEIAIFYGGRTRDGTPRLKVYGYDPLVSAGVYMEGTWIDNVLEVGIPQLPFDSSTGFFELAIPGRNTGFPERVGRDPGFVRANCPNGFWEGTSEFLLGERDSEGLPFGEDAVIRAPDFRSECTGLDGRPALRIRVTGGSKTRGRRSILTTVVTNYGTATVRDVEVRLRGRRVRRAAAIPTIARLAPGQSRKVSTRVTFSGKGRTKVRLAAKGQGARPVVLVQPVRVR
jgi:hypothetical protein